MDISKNQYKSTGGKAGVQQYCIGWNIIWFKVRTMEQNEMAYALELLIDFYRFNMYHYDDR